MSKHKFRAGTWIEREMFESKAYLSLTGFAPQLLVLFLSKRQFLNHGRKGKERRVCTNKNNITMTYIELKEKYNATKPRAIRAIDQLLEKGFICIVNPGGGYKQDKAIYSLSDNWILWHKGSVFERREKKYRGYCKKKK